MFSKIWLVISSLFSKSKLGVLFATLFATATTTIAKEILDQDNQNKAYQFVKELNERKDIDNKEKQKLFNEKMLDWAKKMGKKLNESVINCLRELAVNAIKSELLGA